MPQQNLKGKKSAWPYWVLAAIAAVIFFYEDLHRIAYDLL